MMQFSAVVLMLLLTLKLLRQRGKRKEDHVATLSRRLMMAGTATMALHFAIQLYFGLRLIGITQSVMLNLAMLIPVSYLLSISVLLLQQHGRLSRLEWTAGPLIWTATMALLVYAMATDGQPLLSDTPERRMAETAGAVLYMVMQCYYTWHLTRRLIAMRRALRDYYDHDTDGMLEWMQTSIAGLILLALMAPLAIFSYGAWLFVIAFSVFFFIFYLVDSFCYYLNSPAPAHMQKAETNAAETEQEQNNSITSHDSSLPSEVGEAIAAWTSHGGYRQNGLLQPIAAASIGIPKYQLKEWLHQQGLKYCDWIATLRVEEAKRVMTEHPEWSNDAIAQHCGFADRTVLQRTFKKTAGMTPQKYVRQIYHK